MPPECSVVRKSCSTRSFVEVRPPRQRRTPSFHSVYSGGSRDGDSGDWADSQDREDFSSCQDLYDGDVVHSVSFKRLGQYHFYYLRCGCYY